MLYVVGINYHQTPLEVREAFAPGPKTEALCRALQSIPLIDEVFILSTCNRCEMYCLLDTAQGPCLDLDHSDHPALTVLFNAIQKTWVEQLQLNRESMHQAANQQTSSLAVSAEYSAEKPNAV